MPILNDKLPELYFSTDREAGGDVLRRLLDVCEAEAQAASDEIERLDDLIDIDEIPDALLPYYLRNWANPFDTSLLEKASRVTRRWVLGLTSFGRIGSDRFESTITVVDPLRELCRQLLTIYKRKGTKSGAILACRAVALLETFVADWWTDSAASARFQHHDLWVLGQTSFGTITEMPPSTDLAPYCEVCEGFSGRFPFSEGYGIPEPSTSRVSVDIEMIESRDYHERYAVLSLDVASGLINSNIDLIFQVSTDGGFSWTAACGSLLKSPSVPAQWWNLGQSRLGDNTLIPDREDVSGYLRGVSAGLSYFLFDSVASGIYPDSMSGNIRLRVVPIAGNVLGVGDITDYFRVMNGYGEPDDMIEPNRIPAIVPDVPYKFQRWTLGQTVFGRLLNEEEEINRRGLYHFEVIINDNADDEHAEMAGRIVEYMKPAHTHYDVIRGSELKTGNINWVLGQTRYGVIANI